LPQPALDAQLQIRRAGLVPAETELECVRKIIQGKMLGTTGIGSVEKWAVMALSMHSTPFARWHISISPFKLSALAQK
jgi:hypothetical protein